MKSVFDSHAEKYDNWYEKNQFAYLTELLTLKKLIPEVGKGLEIGVGTGRFAKPMDISIGIDPSFEMLRIARKREIDVVLGEGEALPFHSGIFNYVLLMVTLCFVKNPDLVIKESKRVLNNGGKIIIGIIDKNTPLGKLYQNKKTMFYRAAKLYTAEECIDLLEKNGCKNVKTYQAIFQFPGDMREIGDIKSGHGDGSFVVISAETKKRYW